MALPETSRVYYFARKKFLSVRIRRRGIFIDQPQDTAMEAGRLARVNALQMRDQAKTSWCDECQDHEDHPNKIYFFFFLFCIIKSYTNISHESLCVDACKNVRIAFD